MKKQTLYRIAVSVVFLLLGSLPASAQSLEFLKTFQIPFDFQVNERLLPAGNYIIKRDLQTRQLLLIQCPERKISEFVHTIPHTLPKEPARGSLIFTKYGDQRFLSQVKGPGFGDEYTLIKSKAERWLAQTAEAKDSHAIPNSVTTNN